ncbi:MAG: hypothetical protein ACK4F7_06650, partial [Inhella sp.]
MNRSLKASLAALCLAVAGTAAAAPLVSLTGDLDGFDLGLSVGDSVLSFDLEGVASGADGTDFWNYGGTQVLHVNDLLGRTVIGARLDLVSAGWGGGQFDRAEVFVNGVSVGLLSAGEALDPDPINFVVLDSFDLAPLLSSLTGFDVVEIVAANPDDGGVLDFSRLSFTFAPSNGVPEPAGWAL